MQRMTPAVLPALTLMALLALGSGTAHARANWVRLGDTPMVEIFADTATATRPPGFVKIWTLLNFKTAQRGGWRSERRLFMFACSRGTLEWQQSMYYAEPMGEGEFLHVRSMNRYGVGDLRLVELDPSTRDPRIYREAVPESAYIPMFKSLC